MNDTIPDDAGRLDWIREYLKIPGAKLQHEYAVWLLKQLDDRIPVEAEIP